MKANANLLDVEEQGTKFPTQENQCLSDREDVMMGKLDAMSADLKVLATVKEDVKALTGRMDVHDNRLTAIEKKLAGVNTGKDDDAELNNTNKYKNKKFIKCDKCEQEKKWCTHCNKCGKSDHRRKNCTKN